MKLKRAAALMAALFMAAVSAGCWDAKDINEKALVTLVLTDRKEGEFVFYIEVPNLVVGGTGESGGSGTEQFSIVKGAGKTYAEARSRLNSTMEKPIFLGSTRELIVTHELLEHGIAEYMYRLQNMLDYRKTLHIITTSENPEDFLSVTPENNISVGASIDETLMSLENDGKAVTYTVTDVLEFLYSGYCFVLPNMDISEGRLSYNGYTIIHDGRYLGFIPVEEAYGLVWLTGNNIKRNYTVPFEDNTATVEVKATRRDVVPVYYDGAISFNISFAFDSKILYLERNIKLDDNLQTQIKNNLQLRLLEDISLAIDQSKSYSCDYLGFKELFRISYPNEVDQFEWAPAFVDAAFNISVETSLEPAGMMDFEARASQLP